MHALLRSAIAVASLLVLSSCSTIMGAFVAPEIESPALPAPSSFDLGASVGPARDLTLFPDGSSRPITYNTTFASVQDDGNALFGRVGYALPFPVALSGGLLGANALVEGLWLGGKIQLLGDRGAIAQGPFHLAAFARLGFAAGSRDGDRNGEFGPHGYPWDSDRHSSFGYYGLSLGYRFTDSLIAFVGAGQGDASTRAEVRQATSTDGLTLGGTFKNSFDGTTASLGGGIEIGGDGAKLSVGVHRSRYESQDTTVYDTSLLLAGQVRIHQGD
jgi:hypothetical protein